MSAIPNKTWVTETNCTIHFQGCKSQSLFISFLHLACFNFLCWNRRKNDITRFVCFCMRDKIRYSFGVCFICNLLLSFYLSGHASAWHIFSFIYYFILLFDVIIHLSTSNLTAHGFSMCMLRLHKTLLANPSMHWSSTSRTFFHHPPPFSSTLCMILTGMALISFVDTLSVSVRVSRLLFLMVCG